MGRQDQADQELQVDQELQADRELQVDQELQADHLVVGSQEADLPVLHGSPHHPGARLQLGVR
jgi:hypothetical protein